MRPPRKHSAVIEILQNFVRKRDFYAGGLVILFGLVMALKGPSYNLGTLMHMGPGFLPTALGIILIGLGIAIAGTAIGVPEGEDEDIMRKAAEKYKNWGKWGPSDEVGTLNYTTAEDIVAATRLVKKGKVISLALNFDHLGPQGAKSKYPAMGRTNPIHTMRTVSLDSLPISSSRCFNRPTLSLYAGFCPSSGAPNTLQNLMY